MREKAISRTTIEDISANILRSRWMFPLISLALISILILASFPWYANRFILKATTRVIQLSASSPVFQEIWAKLPEDSKIEIYGADLKGFPPELAALGLDVTNLTFFASRATLQSISLPRLAELEIRSTPDNGIDIGILKQGSISLSLSGTVERLDDGGRRTRIANLEHTVVLNIRAAALYSSARVVLSGGIESFALYDLPIADFRFAPPRPSNIASRSFHSEILSGDLQLLDTGEKVELAPRELILLEGGSKNLVRLEKTNQGLTVDLSGKVERMSVGPPRTGTPFRLDRDVTPSILSYLMGQHELKLLWAAALALLGGFWKARQWALKWEK
jgi:hypothetical protein